VKKLSLVILPERLAICRLSPKDPLPPSVVQAGFWSATRTQEELSVVVPEEAVSPDWRSEPGWRCLKVLGPLDFGLTGVVTSVAAPLAEAGVGVFILSTYDTDYFLLKEADLARAHRVLTEQGHGVR